MKKKVRLNKKQRIFAFLAYRVIYNGKTREKRRDIQSQLVGIPQNFHKQMNEIYRKNSITVISVPWNPNRGKSACIILPDKFGKDDRKRLMKKYAKFIKRAYSKSEFNCMIKPLKKVFHALERGQSVVLLPQDYAYSMATIVHEVGHRISHKRIILPWWERLFCNVLRKAKVPFGLRELLTGDRYRYNMEWRASLTGLKVLRDLGYDTKESEAHLRICLKSYGLRHSVALLINKNLVATPKKKTKKD